MRGSANVASTLVYMAERCTSMRDLKLIHAHAFRTCLHHHTVVLGKLFRFAAVSPFGDLSYAQNMFDQMPHPSTFFYNILIRAHSYSTTPSLSSLFFNRMRQKGVAPDEFSFTFLLKSRSFTTPFVQDTHSAVFKFGFCSHLHVQNALIHLYGVRGVTLLARRVFEDAIKVWPDEVTMVSVISACAELGDVEMGRMFSSSLLALAVGLTFDMLFKITGVDRPVRKFVPSQLLPSKVSRVYFQMTFLNSIILDILIVLWAKPSQNAIWPWILDKVIGDYSEAFLSCENLQSL
ncbi:hypothetical protein TSUD_134780 [Trifolium subterraneum]|uniref:Pentatricopeptide repeat-containing protein n=1 Tax=Trifolium subterraneum TaxID=3900 RepID=A0A2Z6NBI4_TRISU|nr:hypothetical protein TSUD_134780 [Trifolium subterraneum]